ncbi:ABC transporter ATP-binding protein [Arhodomonas sp. AD133]|uniref:ABC transporter ATP-binding protein n=1 Tax=Arhodomonas sp. AD133 TaxID=3415009 RepID=UPI003EBC7B10
MSELFIDNIRKSFGSFDAIKDMSLNVDDKEFVVLVGPSGCGKSTLLRMIAGLETITGGDLWIDNKRMNEVPAARRGLAMVFQSYALYPHMTVAQNMSVGLRIAKVDKETIRQKVSEAARILQLESLLDRKPRQLSGGQRQRVAIGRAIVRNPRVFLFDEPLSNLDAALRLQMRLELARLRATLDATIIYVTHDQVEAMTLADRIVVMNEGQVEQIGTPVELYEKPASNFVAGFIGSPTMNLLPGTVRRMAPDGTAIIECAGTTLRHRVYGVEEGEPITVGVRPEDLVVIEDSGAEAHVEGGVRVVERLGANSFAYLDLRDGTELTVEIKGMARVGIEERMRVLLAPEGLHIFGCDGKRRDVELACDPLSSHEVRLY